MDREKRGTVQNPDCGLAGFYLSSRFTIFLQAIVIDRLAGRRLTKPSNELACPDFAGLATFVPGGGLIQFFPQAAQKAGGSICTDNTIQCSHRFHKDTQVHILRREQTVTGLVERERGKPSTCD